MHAVLEGWAARYKVLPDGSRQIVAFLIPGDFCNLHVTILREMDHGIVALTPARVAYTAQGAMDDLTRGRVEIGGALWRATLIDEAVLRAWIVNIGGRDARERVAHLFCELHARLSLVGLTSDGHFDLPLTQEVIAEAMGLTPVHVNRTLQDLRAEDLIVFRSGVLTIPDVQRLQEVAGFEPKYLHSGRQDPQCRFVSSGRARRLSTVKHGCRGCRKWVELRPSVRTSRKGERRLVVA